MKNNIQPRSFILFFAILCAGACKKSSTVPPPINNGKPQICYTNTLTIQDLLGGVTKTSTETFFYDANHTLTKLVQTEQGTATITTALFSRNSNQYRVDIYYSQTAGNIGTHSQYQILYLNTNERADSVTQYNCVDCTIAEPTTFNRGYVIQYSYSGSTVISEETHVPGKVGAQSTTKHSYDSKGRMDYNVSFDQYGDTSSYQKLIFSQTEANIFKTGEQQEYYKFIYGDALSYQPESTVVYSSSIGAEQKIDWANTGDQNGYLVSTKGTIGGTGYQTMTYAYDCFDK